MATVRNQTWKTVLIIALVLLVLFMIFTGYLWVGVLILLLAMFGGALMFRKLGPPER